MEIAIQTDEDKKIFKVDETILLSLTVKNNDDIELFILESCVSLDYKLTVKNEHGQLVFLTKEGQRLTNRGEIMCRNKKFKLEPGKSKQVSINLLSLYDVSAKGKYFISASRSARKSDNSWIRAESNTIQVIIE